MIPTAVSPVDVDASDPPIGMCRSVRLVLPPVLDVRTFLGSAVLTPALCHAFLVEDEGGVGTACADPLLLDRTMMPLLSALRVVADAPATAVDPIVALDELGEDVPR